MLPKQNRIQTNKEFQIVFRQSKPVYAGNFAFFAAKGRNNSTRFGFVVSNKIDKRATRRNALKRQLRKVAEGLISELKQGYDIVTVVKKDCAFPYEQEEINKLFREGMRKAAVIDDKEDSNKNNRNLPENPVS